MYNTNPPGVPVLNQGKFIPIAKPLIGDEELNAVSRVLRSGMLAQGSEVESLENEFAEYVGVDHAVAVANGTVALDLILKAYKITRGDEVITTPFSFIATSNSILYQGARPIFADIDPNTYTIDPEKVLELVTPRTKAIIAVHLYGHPAEIKPLRDIAEDHGLVLIEDAAQAHGAMYKGTRTGSLGDSAAFSFYATKNMTCGEGGMVTTNDRRIAEKIKLLRNHGQQSKYFHVELGYNLRMTNIQAAIARVQLKKLDTMNEARRRNAALLTRFLASIKSIKLPEESPWAFHVYHQYVIRVKPPFSRDKLKEFLELKGIQTAVHYPMVIPDQPLYKKLGIKCPKECPEARKAASEVLSLPVHPSLSNEDIKYIADSLFTLFDGGLL